MAVNDKKMEKLIERAKQLELRIKNDTAKRKDILAEIDRLSYANFKAEIAKNGMTTDEYALFAEMKKKMADRNISIEDIEKMIDQLSENTEENDDEEKIF